MSSRPHVLITNDDGISAPGIFHLWKALKDDFDITIIAPEQQQSAVGLSITIHSPLEIKRSPFFKGCNAWSVNGTPADCVKLGLNTVLEKQPDLILSGINEGANHGRNVLYSGTLAAVIEGVFHQIPGVAFSAFSYPNPDYSKASPFILPIVQHVIENPLPKHCLLNVNFPDTDDIKGMKLCKQGLQFWTEKIEKRLHPSSNKDYYWMGGKIAKFDEAPDSDITATEEGYIAITPIEIDNLTHMNYFNSEQSAIQKLNDHIFLNS
jgi:5'-nucleotidase